MEQRQATRRVRRPLRRCGRIAVGWSKVVGLAQVQHKFFRPRDLGSCTNGRGRLCGPSIAECPILTDPDRNTNKQHMTNGMPHMRPL